MDSIYTDSQIAQFIEEPKHLPRNISSLLSILSRDRQIQRTLEIAGESGNKFRLIIRQNSNNPLDFSAILAVFHETSTQCFRLRRYNGRSHEHTNHIEGDKFYDFHIHYATERYQTVEGAREDSYAEKTDRYHDCHSAFSCLLSDCGFIIPEEPQLPLFE